MLTGAHTWRWWPSFTTHADNRGRELQESTSDGDDVRVGSLPGRSPEVVEVSERAFAAFKGDGSVVTWGDADFGGNSTEVRELLAADRAV